MFFKNGYLWRIANTERQVVLLPLRSSAERPVSISLKFSQLAQWAVTAHWKVMTERTFDDSGD